jgi:hypothetical protein
VTRLVNLPGIDFLTYFPPVLLVLIEQNLVFVLNVKMQTSKHFNRESLKNAACLLKYIFRIYKLPRIDSEKERFGMLWNTHSSLDRLTQRKKKGVIIDLNHVFNVYFFIVYFHLYLRLGICERQNR